MPRPYREPWLVRPVYTALTLPRLCVFIAVTVTLDGAAQSLDYPALEQLVGEPVTSSATGKPVLSKKQIDNAKRGYPLLQIAQRDLNVR
jgi:hypothetical protein